MIRENKKIENQTTENYILRQSEIQILITVCYANKLSTLNANRSNVGEIVCRICAIILIDIADAAHEMLNTENWSSTNFSAREDNVCIYIQPI